MDSFVLVDAEMNETEINISDPSPPESDQAEKQTDNLLLGPEDDPEARTYSAQHTRSSPKLEDNDQQALPVAQDEGMKFRPLTLDPVDNNTSGSISANEPSGLTSHVSYVSTPPVSLEGDGEQVKPEELMAEDNAGKPQTLELPVVLPEARADDAFTADKPEILNQMGVLSFLPTLVSAFL